MAIETSSLLREVTASGFARLPNVLDVEEVERLMGLIPHLDGAAGTRTLLDLAWGRELARSAKLAALVEAALGARAVPVRGILFDKSAQANWNLDWHQDTKICLKERIETAGFSLWSVKEGVAHCQPPVEVLESMIAVRLHLDPCGPDNGPLRVIPGSHLKGLLPTDVVPDRNQEHVCTAEIGDAILMKPLLLHASSKSSIDSHRRVIHFEYCSAALPAELTWRYA